MTDLHESELVPPSASNHLEVSQTPGPGGASSAHSSFTRVDHMHPASSSAPGTQQGDAPQTSPPLAAEPQVFLSFLLQSGKRRTMSFDCETTVGRVKELVWNGWPSGKRGAV
jgi:hypothetical protein